MENQSDLLSNAFGHSVSLEELPHQTAKRFMATLSKHLKKIVDWVINPENWKRKRTWVLAILFLKVAKTFLNEYGMNPLKKSLNGDHVFLTGAGSGIGRLMAIRLGKRGCKLSLSDINMAGLEETKSQCEREGVLPQNISIFICDVSKKDSIVTAAAIARQAYGPVTILINNAGIVSGVKTLELTD